MKDLLFDPYAGASGDMILGCLLDLGADLGEVEMAVESIGCRLEVSNEERSHISAVKVRIISDRSFHNLSEARSILEGSHLKSKVLKMAIQALDLLAESESTIHGLPKEKSRFHEVGSLDALADIAGSCAALRSLDAEKVYSLPISVGGGFVSSAHGRLPVPSPAALEILRSKNIPWHGGPVEQELLTPTGASLLAVMVDEFCLEYPILRVERVGYGAGSRELTVPNALRGVICRLESQFVPDRVVQLETNIDDMTGEVLGNLVELLMEAGALDVSVIPAMMKKGRIGSIIRVIIKHDEIEKVSRLIIRESGSLGIRIFPSLHRFVAEREYKTIDVEISGSVFKTSVKASKVDNELMNIKPEYEECQKIAAETGLPLREVIRKVDEAARKAFGI
jgi:uncharacterized protein (TIGR00299 family) protein